MRQRPAAARSSVALLLALGLLVACSDGGSNEGSNEGSDEAAERTACGVLDGQPENASTPDASEIIGKTEDQVRDRVQQEGWSLRILGSDGRCTAGDRTDDFVGTRLNVYLDNGRVTEATFY